MVDECMDAEELGYLVASNGDSNNATAVDMGYELLDCLCDLSNEMVWNNIYSCYQCQLNSTNDDVEAFKSVYCDAAQGYERTSTSARPTLSGSLRPTSTASASSSGSDATGNTATDTSEGLGARNHVCFRLGVNAPMAIIVLCNLLL